MVGKSNLFCAFVLMIILSLFFVFLCGKVFIIIEQPSAHFLEEHKRRALFHTLHVSVYNMVIFILVLDSFLTACKRMTVCHDGIIRFFPFVFHARNKIVRVYNNMRVGKEIIILMNWPIKT